jgi:hypothetical protein
MRLRLIVVFICGILFAPQQVLAFDSVSCVQQILTDAGHDVGGVDGAFGSKTAAGGEAFLASPQGAQFTLPPLTKMTVRLWCDMLAPAPSVPIDVQFKGTKIYDSMRRSIEKGAENTDKFFALNFTNLEHREPVTIFAGNDEEWMADNYLKATGFGEGFRPGKLESFAACDPAAEFAWYSLFLCLDHKDWSKGDLPSQGIVAHELWHTIQADLIGDKARACCTSNDQAEAVFGPEWLKEGSATYINYALMDALNVSVIEKDMEFLRGTLQGYSNLLDRNNRQGYREEGGGSDVSQTLGVLATHMLVQRSGFDGLANFYRYLGGGQTKAAFAEAFGISMDDFEVEFIQSLELK